MQNIEVMNLRSRLTEKNLIDKFFIQNCLYEPTSIFFCFVSIIGVGISFSTFYEGFDGKKKKKSQWRRSRELFVKWFPAYRRLI